MKFLARMGCIALFTAMAVSGFAQFKKGDILINLGLGAFTPYNGGLPLVSAVEVGVTDEISVGASIDFLSHWQGFPGVRRDFSALFVGGRGSLHLTDLLGLNTKEVDLYVGVAIGFRQFGWVDDFSIVGPLGNRYSNGLFAGLFAGARYYFNKQVGVFGEVGAGGSSNLRAGLALRL